MENLNPSVVRLSGVLLISGAVTFWSMIIAAIVYQMRTGSLPFKDGASVPARDFYESIAVHPGWWRWVNRCFALGIVMTAFGLTALKLALTDAGDRVFAELGWTNFLIGALLWLVLFTFNLSMAIWAAEVTLPQSLFENSCARQSFGHQTDGSDVNKSFTRLGQPLIVLTQTPIAT